MTVRLEALMRRRIFHNLVQLALGQCMGRVKGIGVLVLLDAALGRQTWGAAYWGNPCRCSFINVH